MMRLSRFFVLFAILLSACGGVPGATPAPTSLLPTPRVRLFHPTLTPAPVTASVKPDSLPTQADLVKYEAYTIPALRARTYGGGEIKVESAKEYTYQTQYMVRYSSDGLSIAAYVFTPKWEGVFPVIFLLQGSSGPFDYLDFSASYASYGFIVVQPIYRNFSPSDSGDNLFRSGYAIDVLNGIALVKAAAGQPGPFEKADIEHIGLWGHSLGGGVALKVMAVSPDIDAVLLYAAISGDERKNSDFFWQTTAQAIFAEELNASPEVFAAVSPANYYRGTNAAVQIYHGMADSVIPVSWAMENCEQMQAQDVKVECFYYDRAEHTFLSRYYEPPYEFGPNVLKFFQEKLKPGQK